MFVTIVIGLLVVTGSVAWGQGKSNAEISADLYLSVATVKAHVSRLLTKLELNNRVQVALLAHDSDLTGNSGKSEREKESPGAELAKPTGT